MMLVSHLIHVMQGSWIIARKVPEFFKWLYYSSQVYLEGIPQPPLIIPPIKGAVLYLAPPHS